MSESREFRTEVEIFGEYYTIVGDSSPGQMSKIAQYVNNIMKQLSDRNPKLSKSQIAVLAALNMADELVKLREEYDNMVHMLEPEQK